jgi:hypothetical protein
MLSRLVAHQIATPDALLRVAPKPPAGLFGEIVVAAVPEPVTLGLLGAGLAAIVTMRKRA